MNHSFLNFMLNNFKSGPLYLMIYGVISILTGLLIILVPEILVAFVASLFFILGITLIGLSWILRKMRKDLVYVKINIDE